jgi:serine/threonine protein kinase
VIEESFNHNEIISTDQLPKQKWAIIAIMYGALKIKYIDDSKAPEIRSEGTSLGAIEMYNIERVTAEGKTKIARIPEASFEEIIGKISDSASLIERMGKESPASGKLSRQKSVWSTTSMTALEKTDKISNYTFINGVISIQSDVSYIGIFTKITNNQKYSIKLISKQKCNDLRITQQYIKERLFLAVLNKKSCPNIAHVISSFQSDKVSYLVYNDIFQCDLATAITLGIPLPNKIIFAACIYKAISSIHSNGLLHRFINPTSIYMSQSNNVPLVCDFRYAKRMDGSKAYTICGDPLYFAPEMVGQVGYTYAADLWMYGLILFELFEVQI